MSTTQNLDALSTAITAALERAVAEGVPLPEAVNAAISAVGVFAADREGPFMAGARMITAGGALTSPEVLASHARTMN